MQERVYAKTKTYRRDAETAEKTVQESLLNCAGLDFEVLSLMPLRVGGKLKTRHRDAETAEQTIQSTALSGRQG